MDVASLVAEVNVDASLEMITGDRVGDVAVHLRHNDLVVLSQLPLPSFREH